MVVLVSGDDFSDPRIEIFYNEPGIKLTKLALKKNFTVINVLKYNNLLSKPHKKDNLF